MTYNFLETQKANFQLLDNGKYTLEIFPQEYMDLNREIFYGNHPKLQAILAGYPMDEIDIKLAQIAAYCEVMLDGDYQLRDRINLCKILTEKLILLREPEVGSIILPFN